MVTLNSKINKNSKLYKSFKLRINHIFKPSQKQKTTQHFAKKALKKAWKKYHKGVAKFIEKEFTDKGYRAIDFEVRDYFPDCLEKAWAEIKETKSYKNRHIQASLF